MPELHQLRGSLVAIFDIESFSEAAPEREAELVQKFLATLSAHLAALDDVKPDSFSTGDGAIVSIGRNCDLSRDNAERFLQFAIDFTATSCRNGVAIRSALNYSQGDWIVPGAENALAGQYIQVGDSINLAARAISFCEPREVIFTEDVVRYLRIVGLQNRFPLKKNDPLTTKHGVRLETRTYNPPLDVRDALYSPDAPSHAYKKFTWFPPISSETLQFFMSNDLEREIRRVVSNAYSAVEHINATKTFLSWSDVMSILTRPSYDPDDKVYVVSRNDRRTGFWTQHRRHQYISFLRGNASRHGGSVNQTRLWVTSDKGDDPAPDPQMEADDIFNDLEPLHARGTLYGLGVTPLEYYEHLAELIFGFTLSTKHQYVIIPVPAVEAISSDQLHPARLGELLNAHRDYHAADGPMKAIITGDPAYVATLAAEFESALTDPRAFVLK